MSSDNNYECRVCKGGRSQCNANHCVDCGEGQEFTSICEREGHAQCSGDEDGCSEPEVVFRVREDQPLLEMSSPHRVQLQTFLDPAVNPFRGTYDGANFIEPSQHTRVRWPAIRPESTSSCDNLIFLIGEHFDNEPNEWQLEARAVEETLERYILVDVWCAGCYPRPSPKQTRTTNTNLNIEMR